MTDDIDPYFKRVAVAYDEMIRAHFRFGRTAVTISSWTGTARAHNHEWGRRGWVFLDWLWPFRRDSITGESHCSGAIRADIRRARAALAELEDPVVTAYLAACDAVRVARQLTGSWR